jgi:hypothetical protein
MELTLIIAESEAAYCLMCFGDSARAHFGAVDVAVRVHCDSLGSAGSLQFEGIRNTVQDLAVFDASVGWTSS